METSPVCHKFPNMKESGLAFGSFLRTLRYILPDPTDLCYFRFLRRSRTWSSTLGSSLFSPSLPFNSVNWVVWLEHLLVKTEAKELWSTSAFPMSTVSCFPDQVEYSFSHLPFLSNVPKETLVIFHIPRQVEPQMILGLLISTPAL